MNSIILPFNQVYRGQTECGPFFCQWLDYLLIDYPSDGVARVIPSNFVFVLGADGEHGGFGGFGSYKPGFFNANFENPAPDPDLLATYGPPDLFLYGSVRAYSPTNAIFCTVDYLHDSVCRMIDIVQVPSPIMGISALTAATRTQIEFVGYFLELYVHGAYKYLDNRPVK